MDCRTIIWTIFITSMILSSGCTDQMPVQGTTSQTTSSAATTTTTSQQKISNITKTPEPASRIFSDGDYGRYKEKNIREHAEALTTGCEDPECKLVRIYGYSIENLYHKSYGEQRANRLGALATSTYGIEEDFALFYYNYLTASGVESNLAVIGSKTYALACGIDMERLQERIQDDDAFKEYVQENEFRSFVFEKNSAFGEECIRLEGPSPTKGTYRYTGQHTAVALIANQSFYVSPKAKKWERIEGTDVETEELDAFFERRYNFSLGEDNTITWRVHKTQIDVEGHPDYLFEAYDIVMHLNDEYSTFTLPETTRFDTVRIKVEIEGSQPFVFYTLQDEDQLDNLVYSIEDPDPDKSRIDYSRDGRLPWDFDYIASCSQPEDATSYEKECVITDAGRRLFVVYNKMLLTENNINVSVRYMEYL